MCAEEIKAPVLSVENPEMGMTNTEWEKMYGEITTPKPPQEPTAAVDTGPLPSGQPEVVVTPTAVEQPKPITPAPDQGITGPKFDEALWNSIPEKFHGKDRDISKALERWAKSTGEAEVKISRQGQELSAAFDLIHQLQTSKKTTPVGSGLERSSTPKMEQSSQPTDFEQEIRNILNEVQVDTTKYYETPVDATKDLIAKAAVKIAELQRERNKGLDINELTQNVSSVIATQNEMNELRKANPDEWEMVAGDLKEVLEQKPQLANVAGIRTAYEEAKERMVKKLTLIRKQLGILDQNMLGQLIDSKLEGLVSKVSNADEIRKTASGLPQTGLGGGQEEIKKTPVVVEKTPEQTVLENILNAGNRHDLFGEYFLEDKK
jgi:hypothetical protein